MSKKILIKEDALKSAIDAMSAVGVNMRLNAPQLSGKSWGDLDIAKAALSEALEQPATPPAAQPAPVQPQEILGWLVSDEEGDDDFVNNPSALASRHYKGGDPVPLGRITTTPTAAQKQWVGLTDADKREFAAAQHGWEDLLAAAEAKLKEKNT
jgi:hypothetical protein